MDSHSIKINKKKKRRSQWEYASSINDTPRPADNMDKMDKMFTSSKFNQEIHQENK